MLRKFGKIAVIATLALSVNVVFAEESDHLEPKQLKWSFEGALGKFDKPAIQRGFQVYKEVCSSCHSVDLVHYRNLQEVGFSEAEVKAIAAEKNVQDGPGDDGEMFTRPAKPSDKFVAPFANEQAVRASNGGALPPDLSLMIKARHDGANYVYSLLTGYSEPPAGFQLADGMNYNPYFPNSQIAMPAPLTDGRVEYQDGTKATVDQMSRDVVAFMQWASEPETEHRKSMGLKVMLFMGIFTVLFYFAKKRVWADVK